jgi:DNA adenine methylase
MALIKTPIRYPGGKSRMVQYLDQFVPSAETWSEYREPFVGGASMFLWMKQKNPDKRYWINDKYYNLYCFWISLRDHCDALVELITSFKNRYPDKESGRELFLQCSDVLQKSDVDPVNLAACFYIVNKTSFSGLTENSHYAPMAYERSFGWGVIGKFGGISSLLQGVKITNLDYAELLKNSDDSFIYLDPPYDIKFNLYGGKGGSLHRGFNHVEMLERLTPVKSQWLLSYNDNEQIRNLYKSYIIDNSFEGKYTMNFHRTGDNGKKKFKGSSELAIRNYE